MNVPSVIHVIDGLDFATTHQTEPVIPQTRVAVAQQIPYSAITDIKDIS